MGFKTHLANIARPSPESENYNCIPRLQILIVELILSSSLLEIASGITGN